MFKKVLTILLIFVVSISFASIEDTITYKRRRGTSNVDGVLDIESGAVRTITSDHSHVHNYEAYSINCIDTLADGEECMFAIYIPDTIEFHLKYINAWGEGSPFKLMLYNNPDTIRMSSDTLQPNNRNQTENKQNVKINTNVTVTDSVDTVGILHCLDPNYFGGGTGLGGSSLAGSSPSEIEWVFKDDYIIIKLQNLSGGPQRSTLCIFWYEIKE